MQQANPQANPKVITDRNRYRYAPKKADYTIDQDWQSYSVEEHDRWDRLFERQKQVLQNRACDAFLVAMESLSLSEKGIPDFTILSDRLETMTGWRVVPVADLVPDDVFFEHLANKRFPAGAFIRAEEEFDYLQEPDVFHDVFGHVPLLANPIYAEFIQAYGKGGLAANGRDVLKNLARLYWYTVEFGLVRSEQGLRLFGAGIMSSGGESVFALESASPNHVAFNLERIMKTDYIIDDFQQTYFVIDSFDDLLRACYQDFGPIYDRLDVSEVIPAHATTPKDHVLQKGTMDYFRTK